MGRKIFTTLIEAVQAHAVEDVDSRCWRWVGALQARTDAPVPIMRWRGKTNGVRRLLAISKYGELRVARGGRKIVATYTCGNPYCVQPDHVALISRLALQRRTAENSATRYDAMLHRQRSRFARDNFAVLDAHKADQIRQDPRPQTAIAASFGVSQATVSSIKRGRTWKDYDISNPFRGLMK